MDHLDRLAFKWRLDMLYDQNVTVLKEKTIFPTVTFPVCIAVRFLRLTPCQYLKRAVPVES